MPVSVFCVLSGSGITPFKCDQIYDTDFVANFMEKTTLRNFENRSTFVIFMNECIVAQFFIETRCIYVSKRSE